MTKSKHGTRTWCQETFGPSCAPEVVLKWKTNEVESSSAKKEKLSNGKRSIRVQWGEKAPFRKERLGVLSSWGVWVAKPKEITKRKGWNQIILIISLSFSTIARPPLLQHCWTTCSFFIQCENGEQKLKWWGIIPLVLVLNTALQESLWRGGEVGGGTFTKQGTRNKTTVWIRGISAPCSYANTHGNFWV